MAEQCTTHENLEGRIALLRFQEDIQRRLPFLRRNLWRSLNYLAMGSSPSKNGNANGNGNETDHEDHDDDGLYRSSKRRKVSIHSIDGENREQTHPPHPTHSTHSTHGLIPHGSKPRGSKPLTMSPSKFYSSSRAAPGFIARFEAQKANPDFVKALRIDILKITANFDEAESIPANYEESIPLPEPITIKCKASIGIFQATLEDTYHGEIGPADYSELCRKTNTAKMTITKTASGIKRDIDVAQPFVFSSEELFVNRTKDQWGIPDNDGPYQTHDLADKYRIHVTLERIGPVDHRVNWPPVGPNAGWDTMSAEYAGLHLDKACLEVKTLLPTNVGRQQRKAPGISIVHKSTKQTVPYALHLQTQWSKPNSMPPPLARFEPAPRLPLHDVSDQNRTQPIDNIPDEAKQPLHTMDASLDEGRSRRVKAQPEYNLKRLSYQTVGRSPLKRKRKSEGAESIEETSDDITITFSFGAADSAENGIPRQHSFTGLRCPFCDRNHSTFDQFRFHLHNDHDNFEFSLRRQNPSRFSFFVKVVGGNLGSTDDRLLKRTFQLGKEATLFDLEKYLNGDSSWIKIREGPIHNHWPDEYTTGNKQEPLTFRPIAPTSSLTSSSRFSHESSLDTSPRSIDEAMDMGAVSRSLSKLDAPRKRKVLVVPKTAKPLFHTITKRQLEPGEELPCSDDEKDESWFHQKHRDMLNDFEDTDVDPAEKEYLNEWNLYAMNHHHNVDVLLPNTVNGFVETHTSWLFKPARKQKFMAHMGVLILQGVITEAMVSKWVKIIRDAEAKSNQGRFDGRDVNTEQDEELVEEQEPQIAKLRGKSDCVCCEYVSFHNRMVCVGQVSLFFCVKMSL